jgi:cellulose synthase/poly-beta-1,6-N-acetylglucosamine synthase-like glycosyltransferase
MTDLELPIGRRSRVYRLLEMLPAVLSYGILFLPAILSLWSPFWAAVFIIVYIIAWTVKALGMSVRTLQGYQTMQRAQQINWGGRLADLERPAQALKLKKYRGEWRSELHERNLQRLASIKNPRRPSDIYHAIIIPVYNEAREVIEPTMQAILDSDYDMNKVIFVLTYEQRGGRQIAETCKDLASEYENGFKFVQVVMHPDGLPNEIRGKGSNITFAAKQLQRWLVEQKICSDNVIVTTLDSDNRPHRSYLAYATYEFIVHPDPKHISLQPLVLFLSNIWDAPAFARVIATGNSFWNIINSLRPHMLRNFSSHSQSMAALEDMNFWSTRTIVEDGHHFWRSYFHYDGHYEVVPIYIPIYQDAVLSSTYRRTLKAQFVQVRRWAYGASDVPYVAIRVFSSKRTVSLWDGASKFVRLLDGHVSWASSSLVLLFGAWAPLFLNPESGRSIIAHELPIIASNLQRFAMIGMFITVFLTFRLLPPRPERYDRRRTIWMLVQWAFMPVTSVVYGSLAAYNAQTHLLLGKYLDVFDVTDKTVVKADSSKITGSTDQ